MNEFNDTIKQLQGLQTIHASDKLRRRLTGLTYALPLQTNNTYVRTVFFRTAIAVAVFLIFAGLGSGIVDAAKNSTPGSPWYPVKQALESVQVHVPFSVGEKKHIGPTPTVSLNSPTPAIGKNQERKNTTEKSGEKESYGGKKQTQKQVKGIQDSIIHGMSVVKNSLQKEVLENNGKNKNTNWQKVQEPQHTGLSSQIHK